MPPSHHVPSWLDELDVDPASTSVAMGTRALGGRPWLIRDDRHHEELVLKAALCRSRHNEVFAAQAGTEPAGAEVAALVEGHGVVLVDEAGLHPLDHAGRSVQEDLCLMERRELGWHLTAASLCFPSRWRLADKIGRHITEVHAPVAGYQDQLATRVDRLFDRLTSRPVWRRNWFVHGDADLFQPDRPAVDPIVPAAEVGTDLVVRSERQTLRLVAPQWILFTIKTQQTTLGRVFNSQHRVGFRHYLANAPERELTRRGISPAQHRELRRALDID